MHLHLFLSIPDFFRQRHLASDKDSVGSGDFPVIVIVQNRFGDELGVVPVHHFAHRCDHTFRDRAGNIGRKAGGQNKHIFNQRIDLQRRPRCPMPEKYMAPCMAPAPWWKSLRTVMVSRAPPFEMETRAPFHCMNGAEYIMFSSFVKWSAVVITLPSDRSV